MRFPASRWMRGIACLALGGAVTTGASAQQSAPPPREVARAVVRVEQIARPADVNEITKALTGLIAVIDPATGQLRAATPEEHEELTGQVGVARRAAPAEVVLPDGTVALEMDASRLDLLTATRAADGSLVYRCTHGLDAASPTFVPDHDQEVRHDR